MLKLGHLVIDLSQRSVELHDERLKLTPTEYDLLKVLALNAGRVMTHQQLLKQVWGGQQYESDSQYLSVYVGHLTEKNRGRPDKAQVYPYGAGHWISVCLAGWRLDLVDANTKKTPSARGCLLYFYAIIAFCTGSNAIKSATTSNDNPSISSATRASSLISACRMRVPAGKFALRVPRLSKYSSHLIRQGRIGQLFVLRILCIP